MEASESHPDKSNGNKYNPSKHGPIAERGCTDAFCCILFFIFIIGMAIFGALGFTQGNPKQLVLPRDSEGRICGLDDQETKRNLFYFDLTKCLKNGVASLAIGCPTPQVCVSDCPTQYRVSLAPTMNRNQLICRRNVDPNSTSIYDLVYEEKCAAYTLASAPILQRCVPKIISDAMNSIITIVEPVFSGNQSTNTHDTVNSTVDNQMIKDIQKGLAQLVGLAQVGEEIAKDLTKSWPFILVAYGLAAVLAVVWIVIMRCIAKPLVYLTSFAVLGLLGFGTGYCFYEYVQIRNQNNNASQDVIEFTVNIDLYLQNQKVWLALGIISGCILVILVLLFVFLFKRIQIALALVKEGSRAVSGMLSTLLWPIFPVSLQVGVIAYWLAATVFIASSGKPLYEYKSVPLHTNCTLIEGTPCNPTNFTFPSNCHGIQCTFKQYGFDVSYPLGDYLPTKDYQKYFDGIISFLNDYTWIPQAYNLFGFFWLLCFIHAMNQCVLAGAFASYYWAFDKSHDVPTLPLLSSIGRTLLYHTGSLAFGSFILAFIHLIRILLQYLEYKFKGKQHAVAAFFLKCLACCFWCFEKCMKYLTKNAYIVVAVHGSNFCVSAKKAFFMIINNAASAGVLDNIAAFLLFIGKMLVVSAVAVFAWFFFSGSIPLQEIKDVNPALKFPPVTIAVIILGSFIIATSFFGVYHMSIDTMFICYLEDLEINDGSLEKPYFMPKELMGLLGKKNKPEPEEEP